FDVGDSGNSISRKVYDPTVWTDMMTYCNNEWISPYTYMGILDNLRSLETANAAILLAAGAEGTGDDNLLVSGKMNLTRGQVQLRAFWRLPGLELTSRPTSSDYSILLLDGTGATLAAYPFQPKRNSDILAGEDQTALLSEAVPFVQGTARIVIAKKGLELASRQVSPNS